MCKRRSKRCDFGIGYFPKHQRHSDRPIKSTIISTNKRSSFILVQTHINMRSLNSVFTLLAACLFSALALAITTVKDLPQVVLAAETHNVSWTTTYANVRTIPPRCFEAHKFKRMVSNSVPNRRVSASLSSATTKGAGESWTRSPTTRPCRDSRASSIVLYHMFRQVGKELDSALVGDSHRED